MNPAVSAGFLFGKINMSKKLKIRTLKRKKFPYGKFKYIVALKRFGRNPNHYCKPNGGMIEEMRSTLGGVCQGGFRFDYQENSRGQRVYTYLYLENPMDLAMLKLCHHDKMFKIYKVEINQSPGE